MKITRRGRYRDHGADVLVKTDALRSITWDEETRSVKLVETGSKGGSTHQYTVVLTAAEVASLVEAALVQAAHGDRSAKAHGQAAATYVRSMLCEHSDDA